MLRRLSFVSVFESAQHRLESGDLLAELGEFDLAFLLQLAETHQQKLLEVLLEEIVLLPQCLPGYFLSCLFFLVGFIALDGRLAVEPGLWRSASLFGSYLFFASAGKIVLLGTLFGEMFGWWDILLGFLCF